MIVPEELYLAVRAPSANWNYSTELRKVFTWLLWRDDTEDRLDAARRLQNLTLDAARAELARYIVEKGYMP